MSTADKLIYANGTKVAIRDAIVAKGVAVPEETTFRQYATKIGEIETGGGATSDPGRPSDWLKLSDHIAPGDRKIVGNYAVWPGIDNYITINNPGGRTITITLSDGSAPVVLAPGNRLDYIIDHDDLDPATTTSEGFRQCLVEMEADVAPGEDWLWADPFREAHPQASQYSSSGWLDMIVSGIQDIRNTFQANSTGRVFAGNLHFFESVDGIFPVMQNAFQSAGAPLRSFVGAMPNPENVPFGSFFMWEFTTVRQTKINLIENVEITQFNSTQIASCCDGCANLRRFVLDDASMVTSTNATAFRRCFSLQILRLPGFALTFSIADCNMNADNLNTLFGDLAVVGSATITITGNPGAATCDTTIATAKGWTVAA